MNELSILFRKMNIDTQSVLDAAKTKWNFLPFEPGLVGGHCIGVDPYYLTFKAKVLGYKPKIILAGRELNDKMGSYVVTQLFKMIKEKKIKIKEPNILVMGLTFKENCADIRNSGVKKIIDGLKKHKCKVDIYDPWADAEEVRDIYNLELIQMNISKTYDAIIIAVAHDRFKKMGINKISNYGKKNCIIFDLKNLFKSSKVVFKL
jgi:UDP-N-acetyl-D-galactosamine dehydrogenase